MNNRALGRALEDAMYRAVGRAAYDAVDNWAVYHAVYEAMYGAVDRDVYDAVNEAAYVASPHPKLEKFLKGVGGE